MKTEGEVQGSDAVLITVLLPLMLIENATLGNIMFVYRYIKPNG